MDKLSLHPWWRFFKSFFLALGLLLTFLAIVEILRVYIILRDFNPWLGLGFIALLICGAIWVLVRFIIAFWSLPRAPNPPEILNATNPTPEQLLNCGHFLRHRIIQLQDNPKLSSNDRESLKLAQDRLIRALRSSLTNDTISEVQATLAKIFMPIDKMAERIVQECVRDVMLAVAVSPYRSADLLIVVYRNCRMILQLAKLYQTRPSPIEQIRIFKDVLAIVATVNFLNFSEKFIERLFEQVPVLGQVVGDVAQGVGAGLLTSATGHAALGRCRSIGAWNREDAQMQLVNRMSRFVRDVKSILQADVLPKLKPRFPEVTAVSEKISAAFDSSVENMDHWIWRPVTKGSSAVAFATLRGGSVTLHSVSAGAKNIGRWSKSLLVSGKNQIKRQRDKNSNVLNPINKKEGKYQIWRWRKKDSRDDCAH